MVKWLLANHCMLPLHNVKKIEKQSCRYSFFFFNWQVILHSTGFGSVKLSTIPFLWGWELPFEPKPCMFFFFKVSYYVGGFPGSPGLKIIGKCLMNSYNVDGFG